MYDVIIIGAGVSEITDHLAGVIVNYVGLAFFAFAVILTVISGVNYLVKNREVLTK